MDVVRIGFVGVGSMGQCAHLKNYATLEGCQVVALAELRPQLREAVAARYGIPSTYPDHREMLACEDLDGIVASQPFTRHGTLVPELLETRVPIFTEKPLAGSVQMGEQIVRALAWSGAWQMVGYHKRSDPATMRAKAEIERLKESGELGALRYVRILMPAGDWVAGGFCDLIRTDEPAPQVATDPPPSDMDAETYREYLSFVNYYIHQVNLMRHLLGETWTARYGDRAGHLLVGDSPSGVTCTIEMSPYQTSIDWQESALVCFEHGWVKLELPAPLAFTRPGRVEIFRDPGNGAQPHTEIPQLPWVHAMWQQARNFVEAVAGRGPTMCTAEDALADIRLAREYIRIFKG